MQLALRQTAATEGQHKVQHGLADGLAGACRSTGCLATEALEGLVDVLHTVLPQASWRWQVLFLAACLLCGSGMTD